MVLVARFLRASSLIDDVFDPSDAGGADMPRPGVILEACHELQ